MSVFKEHEQQTNIIALRAAVSKEILHERRTMGAVGNDGASRVWKGESDERELMCERSV